MRQAMMILLAMGLVFAVIGCTPGDEPSGQGRKIEKAATKTEGAKVPTKTEAEKAATQTEGEKAPTKTEGEKAPTKTEGEKAATKTEGEKAPTKTEAAKAVPTGKIVIRVNCASDADYTDQAGNKWVADQMWTEGKTWGAVEGNTATRNLNPGAIAGTQAPGIYLTERYGMSGYRFDVPNGKYTVRLHFAETWDGIKAAGERVFTVKIQGKPIFENVDPFKDGGGLAKPVVKEAKGIEVADGKLAIEFVEQAQSAEINGIEIMAE